MLASILFSIALALLGYGCYATVVFLLQRRLVFPAPRHPGSFAAAPLPADAQQLLIESENARTEAWLLPPERAVESVPLLVFFHGNAETIDRWGDFFTPAQALGFAVLLVEYPGYGRCSGQPSQRAIRAVALAAIERARTRVEIAADHIVLFGHSLGGGVALDVTASVPSAGLILLSTFRSVREFSQRYLVPGWLARDPFDNLSRIARYQRPVLLFHGSDDAFIPVAHSQALAAATGDACLIELECAHGDCLPQHSAIFWRAAIPFLNGVRGAHGIVLQGDRT